MKKEQFTMALGKLIDAASQDVSMAEIVGILEVTKSYWMLSSMERAQAELNADRYKDVVFS